MTNINCSASCVYQKEGKCCFESVSSHTLFSGSCTNNTCAYFVSLAKEGDLNLKV